MNKTFDHYLFSPKNRKLIHFHIYNSYNTALSDINNVIKRTKVADTPLFLIGHSMVNRNKGRIEL